jgi:hypothetical protein
MADLATGTDKAGLKQSLRYATEESPAKCPARPKGAPRNDPTVQTLVGNPFAPLIIRHSTAATLSVLHASVR